MNILVIGTGAREHAIVWRLAQNPVTKIYNYGPTNNPGITALAQAVELGDVTDVVNVVSWAQQQKINLAWIGPEAPLAVGIVDALEGVGISCIGPTQLLSQLESSKGFTRELLTKYEIDASPAYKVFTAGGDALQQIEAFMQEQEGQIVVKPDGLTGGKGVKVMGDHFQTVAEALEYCAELFEAGDESVVIEEKLVGQEFSLMTFSDGGDVVHMPVVQDHKRALVNDEGPNTGGMGSYTMSNHSMPFLQPADIKRAQEINEQVLKAIQPEYEQEYKGILYGGFMAVKNGVRLIEYNARFGDPEVMNLLSLLETDLTELTQAMVNHTLHQLNVKFANKASVCKYVVPEGYPDSPVTDQPIDVSEVDLSRVNLFYGSVDQTDTGLIEKGSRTIGVVAVADTVEEAEHIVEVEINKITGPLVHRSDIGTAELIARRVDMMQEIRGQQTITE